MFFLNKKKSKTNQKKTLNFVCSLQKKKSKTNQNKTFNFACSLQKKNQKTTKKNISFCLFFSRTSKEQKNQKPTKKNIYFCLFLTKKIKNKQKKTFHFVCSSAEQAKTKAAGHLDTSSTEYKPSLSEIRIFPEFFHL